MGGDCVAHDKTGTVYVTTHGSQPLNFDKGNSIGRHCPGHHRRQFPQCLVVPATRPTIEIFSAMANPAAAFCFRRGFPLLWLPVMADIEEFPEVRVEVTDVVFMPTLESPPDKPFPFVYFITVRNDSAYPITIRARKWVVKQHDGETVVVEGDGVVGQTPRLQPGEAFSYNSYHTIGADSEASGALFGEREDGSMFFTRIPAFRMEIPDSLG